jgi:hypothetical protein
MQGPGAAGRVISRVGSMVCNGTLAPQVVVGCGRLESCCTEGALAPGRL